MENIINGNQTLWKPNTTSEKNKFWHSGESPMDILISHDFVSRDTNSHLTTLRINGVLGERGGEERRH